MPTSQRRRGEALTSTGCGARTSACVPHASTMGNGLRVSSQDVASCACCWRVAPTAIRLHYDMNTVHAVNQRWCPRRVSRRGEVGVDIEALHAQFDLDVMARRICTPRERARWAALPAVLHTRALLTYWTRKEAYLKGKGCGLDRPLGEIDVSETRPRGAGCVEPWQVHDINVGDDYVAAVALAGTLPVVVALHEYADVACTSDIDYRTA